MIDAVNTPFKYSPAGFDGVGMLSITKRVCHTVVNLYAYVLPVGLAVKYPVT